MDAFLAGAMGAAVDDAIGFNAVADNFDAAITTGRRQHLNGAFKRIKHVPVPGYLYGKGFIVIVATKITCCHFTTPNNRLVPLEPDRFLRLNCHIHLWK
jgi:hypothetical protein